MCLKTKDESPVGRTTTIRKRQKLETSPKQKAKRASKATAEGSPKAAAKRRMPVAPQFGLEMSKRARSRTTASAVLSADDAIPDMAVDHDDGGDGEVQKSKPAPKRKKGPVCKAAAGGKARGSGRSSASNRAAAESSDSQSFGHESESDE